MPSATHQCKQASESSSDDTSSSSSASTASWNEPQEEQWQPSEEEQENDSTDKERQLLLLMLLAQVCALHDPSPKTFTVHVLELFERGILDRESIRFLFELGLVPTPTNNTPLLMSSEQVVAALTGAHEHSTEQQHALVAKAPPQRTMSMEQVRAQEASAIRLHLEQSQHGESPEQRTTSSWAVEHHPLSLSRYQREFRQVRLLNAGAFGQVFHVVSKLDGMEYAIKRVAFGVNGYSSHDITQAVREVQCLAQCHHPHCVRYYTSWLEPSWMTGSSVGEDQPLLLTNGGLSRRASFSFGSHDKGFNTEWTESKDDSFVATQSTSYHYEICLFIQMQLCNPLTLADWIRTRNARQSSPASRAGPAIRIFTQLLQGMAHVHEKNIVHRDLKPANVFMGKDGTFLIGDFGLSRLLQNANRDFRQTSTVRHGGKHKDPLTAGIGTASYAAPEQLNCCEYGKEADIFSLGLILLELFCVFGTEHERIDTFDKCRSQSLPSWLSRDYPNIADVIQTCTHTNPAKRPTAADLVAEVLTEQDILRMQLEEKDQQLKKQRSEIDEKDRIIQDLRSQVKRMSMEQDGGINDKDTDSKRRAKVETVTSPSSLRNEVYE